MKKNVIRSVNREDTDCMELLISLNRSDNGDDGVLFIAWHKDDDGTWVIQTDFIVMDFDIALSYIRDFSGVSAQDYVDSFNF